MPQINVAWKESTSPKIIISIKTGNQNVSVTNLEINPPWKGRSGFNQLKINANSKRELNISFKQKHEEDLSFSMAMMIDELGGWTQHLRLSPPMLEQEIQLRSVENDEN
jgi:hypothetical protein